MKKKITIILTILISIVFLNERINAAEITIPVQYKSTGTFDTNVSIYDYSWAYKDFTSTTDNTRQEFLIPFTTYIDGSSTDYIEFDLMITEPTTTELTSENIGRYCSKYSSEFSGYVEGNVPTYDYTCQRYTQYISGESIQVVDNKFSLNSMQIYIHYDGGGGAVCTLSNTSKVYCPTNRKQIKDIGINLIFRAGHTSYMRILASRDYNLYIGSMQEMVNKQNETNNILKQEHQYNKNESQSTQEQKQEIDNYETQENNLRNQLNLNIEDTEISVNPNANNFIWEVVNKLRTMSGKIVLLFTSVLSLGIMKMILGR